MITIKVKVDKEDLKTNMDSVVEKLLHDFHIEEATGLVKITPVWADVNYEDDDKETGKITVSLNCYQGEDGDRMLIESLVTSAKKMYFTE